SSVVTSSSSNCNTLGTGCTTHFSASSAFTSRSANVVRLAVNPENNTMSASHIELAGKTMTVNGTATTYRTSVIHAHASRYRTSSLTSQVFFRSPMTPL